MFGLWFVCVAVAIPPTVFLLCWCSNAEKGFVDSGKREGGENLGRCDRDCLEKGVDLKILLGVKCVDEVALQAMPQQHPGRVAWEVQARGRIKDRRMVKGLFDSERRGRKEGFGPNLSIMKRRMGKKPGRASPST